MKYYDLVIIGGGSAGMAAAIQAKHEGIEKIIILEKNGFLGGILNQCIHNGFGLTEFKEELTGPEYLSRFVTMVNDLNIEYKLNSQVTNLTKDKVVHYSNNIDGFQEIKAKAVILATGCYERGAGEIHLPGDRCSGIITAGTAQNYLNIHGYLCGKKVVILGSGDIGLIMARRLTLEGAKVLCVSEIMPYSNGLNRNIVQCLNDFDIPLYLSRSVSKVVGKNRLERVILSAVDDNFNFIPGTEMEIECDTLILSVGLKPYVSLFEYLDIPLSSTKGAIVDEHMSTLVNGIFACGNCLHVHDVVDFVSDEGRLAGHGASIYIKSLEKTNDADIKKIVPMDGISYVVPQLFHIETQDDITIKFRVKRPMKNVDIILKEQDNIIMKWFKPILIPSEMVMLKINRLSLEKVHNNLCIEAIERN